MRRLCAVVLTLALAAGALSGGVAQAQAGGTSPPGYREPARVPSVAAKWVSSKPEAEEFSWADAAADREPPGALDGNESAEVMVRPGAQPVTAGGLPVSVALPAKAGASTRVQVEALPASVAEGLSPFGVALRLRAGDGAGVAAPLSVGVDLAAVGVASGGELSQRLQLTRLTGCRDVAGGEVVCDGLRALPSRLDRASGRLIAQLSDTAAVEPRVVASDPAAADDVDADASMEEAFVGLPSPRLLEPVGGDEFSVLAVTASSSSASGSYAAAPFSVVSDAQVGTFSGSAELSYEIPVPGGAAGPEPTVELAYSSATVDGMSASTNNQPSEVGMGWSLDLGSVRRIFKPCADGRDTCSAGGEYTLSLNGVSSRLVHESGGSYLLASDPRWRITRKAAPESAHADINRHYWEVVTPDGTKYLFGRQFEAETGVNQWSAQPLQLKNSTTCAGQPGDICKVAWRWDVDRIEDTNGNVVSYFYERELNQYRPFGLATPREYVRAAHPVRIEYTKRAGTVGGSQPNARVLLNYEARCGGENKAGFCNWPADFSDTPSDLWCRNESDCSSSTNPQTFFSQLRLAAVTTQVRAGSRWVSHGTWDMAQTFPDYAESGTVPVYEEPKLALYRVHRRPGGDYAHYAFSQLETETANARSGLTTSEVDATDLASGGHVTAWHAGDFVRYNKVWFGGESGTPSQAVIWHRASTAGGKIQLWIDAASATAGGTKIAEFDVTNTSGWKAAMVDITAAVSGNHDLFVTTTSAVPSSLALSWVSFRTTMSAVPSLRWTDFAASDTTTGFNDDFVWKPNRDDTGSGVSHMYLPRVKTLRNELGGESTYQYGQPAGCASGNWHLNATHCYPEQVEYNDTTGIAIFRKWVVTQLTHNPVFGGAPNQVYTYEYTNPAWRLTNRPDRDQEFRSDFRGHETVKVIDSNGDYTQHRFFQGMDNDPDLSGTPRNFTKTTLSSGETFPDANWLAGMEFETLVKDAAGNRLHDSRTSYHAARTGGPSTVPESDYAAWFTAPSKEIDVTKTGTDKTTQTRYSYDTYGNITHERLDGDLSDSSDDRLVFTEYTANTAAWIVDTPWRETLYDGAATTDPVAERTGWRYDGNPGATDPPIKGNLTEEREFYTAADYALTAFTNDAWGRTTAERVVEPSGTDAVTTTTYDPLHGYETATRDYINPNDGDLTTNPGDHVTTAAYDDYARPAVVTDANGHPTTLTYDGYDRLTSVTAPGHGAGPTQKFSYSTALPARTTSEQRIDDAGGGTFVADYEWADGYGRVFQTQTAMPQTGTRSVTTTRYDNLGRVRYESDPYQLTGDPATGGANGEVLPDWATVWAYAATDYDAAGRVTAVSQRHHTTTIATATATYDGWETRDTDANGNRVDTLTDAYDNIIQVEEFNGTAVDATTTYTYDATDTLTSVVDDAGNTTTVDYDLLGRKTAMSDPDSGDWTYTYNHRGDLTSQTDGRGQQLSFAYDGLGRMSNKHAGGPTGPVMAEWAYDAAGHKGLLASTTAHYGLDGTVQTRYPSYDALGRPLRQETWIPSGASQWDKYATQTTYKPDGSVATLTYPGDANGGVGEAVTYGYHQRTGQPNTMTGTDTYVAAAAYTGFGAAAQLDHGAASDNLTRQWQYDTHNRLAHIVADAGSASLVDTNISYDPAGNVTETVDHTNGAQAVCHTYDHLNRLTRAYTRSHTGTASDCNGTYEPTVGDAAFDHSYAYDTVGNLQSSSATGDLVYPTAGSNRPHAVTAINNSSGNPLHTFAYDNAGNMTTRTINGQATQTLTYDHDNRLASVTQGSSTTRFLYDADGQRVQRRTVTETTNYVAGLYEVTGATTTKWYEFAGEPIAYRDNSILRFMVSDHQGSTSVVYTPATDDLVHQRYYPFGDLRGTDGTITTDIGYTGQRRDYATGLMYYHARYYDPLVGRFAQPDNVVPDPGNPQDLNRYSYVRNNPTTYTDPTGNILWEGGTRSGGRVSKIGKTRYYGPTKNVIKRSFRPGSNDRIAKRGKRAAAKVYKYRPPRRRSSGANDRLAQKRKKAYTKGRAPRLRVGKITWQTRIVKKRTGIIPDGMDPDSYRFRMTWDTDAGVLHIITKESCRTIPRFRCEPPFAVRNVDNVSLYRMSSYRFSGISDGSATLHFNFRANGFGVVPGTFPGGISGKFTVSRHGTGGRVAAEHDQFPTHELLVNNSKVYVHKERGLVLPGIPLGLSPPYPDAKQTYAWN